MEGLFNNPIILKLQEAGQRLGRNKFLAALQAAMMALVSVTMVGAVSQIACAVLGDTMLGVVASDSALYAALNLPNQFTMGLLSLWVAGFLAYNYARNLNMKSPILCAIETVVIFIMVAGGVRADETGATVIDMAYLGSTGMFVSFLVAFAVVRIDKLCHDRKLYVRMPDIVPEALQEGFAAIVPVLLDMVAFIAVSEGISAATGGAYNLCSGLIAVLSAPLATLISVPGMVIILTFGTILWCFGIHGTAIVQVFVMPVFFQAVAMNADLVASGQEAVFNAAFLYSCLNMTGGSGNTFPLVLMSLRAKSEQLRAVSKVALVPSWFNINEPLVFGMPIMYNPLLCIPYIITVPVVTLLTYAAYAVGILTPEWIPVFALLPMGFRTYFATLNPLNFAWDYLMAIPCLLIYYPFFKMYDRQLAKREQEEREALATENAA